MALTADDQEEEDYKELMADLAKEDEVPKKAEAEPPQEADDFENDDLLGFGFGSRSSLVQGNPHAMWGGAGEMPRTPPWKHGPRLVPMTHTGWEEVIAIINGTPYTSNTLNRLSDILEMNFGGDRGRMAEDLNEWLVEGGGDIDEEEQDWIDECNENFQAAMTALDEA